MASRTIDSLSRRDAPEHPLIKTIHTAETLTLALARQQRWLDRHVRNQSAPSSSTEPMRMAKAGLREASR